MTSPAIVLQNVEYQRSAFTLGPLNLEVPRGSIFGLIGPNSAGKTTTLDLLMGMGVPSAGSITMLDRELSSQDVQIKQRTAYVSPDIHYDSWGKVGRVIDFVRGFYAAWNDDECERLLQAFELSRSEFVRSLSFGSRMKLALLLALCRSAELLLLDEPTVGLDAGSRRQLYAELLAFMQQENRTIVIASHHLVDVERFADHLAIMKHGRLLLTDRMDQLLDKYRQVDVQLGSAGLPDVPGVRLLRQDRERAVLLVDANRVSREALHAAGVQTLSETALTLEDLFIALTGTTHPPAHRSNAARVQP